MAVFRWRLRMAAAQREVWTGAQLRRLLADKADLEISAASVSALLTRQPAQVKLDTLAALCTALECTPNDLLELDTSSDVSKRNAAAQATSSREDRAKTSASGAGRRRGGRRTPPPF